MRTFAFDAQPTAALFDRSGAIFALGDGSVRFESGETAQAHDGVVLCAVAHPSGDGVVTGGDDGCVVWSRRDEVSVLAEAQGRWIDAIDASPTSGLIAFAHGRNVGVLDTADLKFRRDFGHERTVSGVAFDPKGRRIAASTYGGAALWFARIAQQKPTMLKWAGSHTSVGFSPDGGYVVTTMQDNQLHGWRLKDGKDMRMGGYPAKVKSFGFLDGGSMMATSGANGVVLWPFVGANGPMGREAIEIGHDEGSTVALVAARPSAAILAAGLSDGRVWAAAPAGQGLNWLKTETGPVIVALAVSADGRRAAWADEGGTAAVAEI